MKHTLTSTRWAQSNGQVERVMRTLIPTIMTSMENEESWDQKITEVERNLNVAINKTTNKSPFEALHGYLPVLGDGKLSMLAEGDNIEWRPPEDIQAEIREKIRSQQQKYKTRYDAKRFKGLRFEVGDVVMLKAQAISTGQSTKTQQKYKGPLVVIEVLPCDTYRVASIEGVEGRRFTTIANVSQLKIYRNCNESETESEDERTVTDEESILESPDENIEEYSDRDTQVEAFVQEGNRKRKVRRPKRLDDYELDLSDRNLC